MKRTAITSRTLASPTAVRLPPGAEWYEAVIRSGLAGYGGPPHGDSSRWDWGVTASTLRLATDRHQRMQRIVDDMTPEQRMALWSDGSPIAAQMRKLVRV